MRSRPLLSALVVVGIAAVIAYARVVMAVQESPYIEGPDHWVAFHADFKDVALDGTTTMTGKIYRGADGSYRREGTAITGDSTVLITNLTLGQNFERRAKSTTWTVRPLGVAPGEYRLPLHRRATALQKDAVQQYEGLTVYPQADHPASLEAPELNFFAIVAELPRGGKEVLSNITIGNVPAEVFTPPPGAEQTFTSTPGGIIKHTPPYVAGEPSHGPRR
jgi:hypothetical protein